MYNYTFIIPHKNIPLLLKRCLDSIPHRPDIEIIVIDDNSNEESIKGLKKLSRENFRIIYTTENKGAGFARNIGIKEAKGLWVLFADADDLFFPNLLEKIDPYKDLKQKLVLFKSCCRDSNNLTQVGQRQSICNSISCKIEDFKNKKINHIELLLGAGVPWAKMVRLDFLKEQSIYFEEVQYSNDVGWITQMSIKTNQHDIAVSNEVIYCWTDREDSLYYTRNKEAFLCRFNVRYRQHLLLTRNNIPSLFNFCNFVDVAKEFGSLFLIQFYKSILQGNYNIPPVYRIEKKAHLKIPYFYLVVQLIKTICNSFRGRTPPKKEINF